MSTAADIEHAVTSAPKGTLFETADFDRLGPRSAIEPALSRLVKIGRLARLRKGLYFRPAPSRFGIGVPASMSVALKIGKDGAPGPTGAAAANALGLSTQLPPVIEVAVVGTPPTGMPGIHFRERSNRRRITAGLLPKEVALLELARANFAYVEDMNSLVPRVRELTASGEIDVARLIDAAKGEPRAARTRISDLLAA